MQFISQSVQVTIILYVYGALGSPRPLERIVGGSVTTIADWPSASALLYTWNLATYSQACGGTIITNKAILSAAHCFYGDAINRWRARVGSTYANSRGVVHKLKNIIIHKNYDDVNIENDIAVLHTLRTIIYNTKVQPAPIASSSYNLKNNEVVWAIGWGVTSFGGSSSERLREVQIWTINQSVCRNRYAKLNLTVSDNKLCSGWLNVGGRDQYQGDSGGPLFHNNIVVGVCSWGYECAHPIFPSINVRVSRYVEWIQRNSIYI